MAKQIIIGLFLPLLGGALMYFSASFVETFGRIDWAEQHVGGTRNAYLLVGVILIMLGVLILFGVVPLSVPAQSLPTLSSLPS